MLLKLVLVCDGYTRHPSMPSRHLGEVRDTMVFELWLSQEMQQQRGEVDLNF